MNLPNPEHWILWKSNQRFLEAERNNLRLFFHAFLVGLIAGAVGSVFRLVLANLDTFRDHVFSLAGNAGFMGYVWPVVYSITGIGAALFLVRKFAPETSGSGIQEIEGALDNIRPLRWKRVLPVKFIASLFSLGSGLLLGREGPTIQIGAGIGKMTKDLFKQPDEKTNVLVSAGAAAGLASAFNAPLAGIIFVIEEMHGHFRYSFFSVAAIMVASGTADLVVRTLIGVDPVLKMTVFTAPPVSSMWLFVMLGIVFSLIGLLFNKLLILGLDLFSELNRPMTLLIVVLSGIIIALTGTSYPDMISGGYSTIRMLLDHSFTLQFLLILIVTRLVLTIFSYSTGVPGGIFAPLLALGVAAGMLFGSIIHVYYPEMMLNPGIFAVAGMAGIFASTVRAPLTGLVLAVEMTSNYEMILPLIITTVVASVLTSGFGNQPIYTTLLKRSRPEILKEN